MNSVTISCGKCHLALDPSFTPVDGARVPCPSCGSLGRTFDAVVEEEVQLVDCVDVQGIDRNGASYFESIERKDSRGEGKCAADLRAPDGPRVDIHAIQQDRPTKGQDENYHVLRLVQSLNDLRGTSYTFEQREQIMAPERFETGGFPDRWIVDPGAADSASQRVGVEVTHFDDNAIGTLRRTTRNGRPGNYTVSITLRLLAEALARSMDRKGLRDEEIKSRTILLLTAPYPVPSTLTKELQRLASTSIDRSRYKEVWLSSFMETPRRLDAPKL